MALMAGALLVTLSVSAAFGAAPTADEGNRGQSIASFVHELIFGTDEPEEDLDEEVAEDEELVEEEELVETDEELLDDELDEELDEELVDEEEDEEANAHGQCVAEEASDKSDEVDEDGNHGAVVSEAARDTCWETDDEDESEELVEEEDEEASEEEDEESESHGACVSAAAQDKDGSVESELKNHGKWVSQHARYTCWGLDVPGENEENGDDETSDTEEAATDADGRGKPDKADRGGGKPSWAGQGGNSNGRGGGRP
jgi:hypothetical protein